MSKLLALIPDTDLDGTKPCPYIPRITYTCGDGIRFPGYYVFHNKTMRAFGDEFSSDDFNHVIIQDSFADWSMPRELQAMNIIPDGGTIRIEWPDNCNTDNISDGCHTFGELYRHRAGLFATICQLFPDKAWKSKKHEDGSMYDGMFIVGIETPLGQASYHCDLDPYWKIFRYVKEIEYAPHYDGYTDNDSLSRIMSLAWRD